MKFQTKDSLGRQVQFGLNVVEVGTGRHTIVVRQTSNDGPSITNAAEDVWRALEAFTAPGARCIEYYPESGSMCEVTLKKNDIGDVVAVSWEPVLDGDRTTILSLIKEDDEDHRI